ncbi:MAG TPA: pYEATS domain-containing protein [Kofleriaceae bacterium]|jgi:hypothetical protein|nr:pYEATS domain-containing protein [Kofleriaceae bacterium]
MPLKLAQADRNVSPDWWEWEVWLEAPGPELDDVTEVTYLLHPTFVDPVRVVTDRASAFRLHSAGWGEFTIRAEARLRDGKVRHLKHPLKLHTATARSAPAQRPAIFLSYAATDGRFAGQLSRALESSGMKVAHSGSLSLDVPWNEALHRAVNDSSAVVILQLDTPSTAVEDALIVAHSLDKPTIRVQIGPPPSLSPSPADTVLRFTGQDAPEVIVDRLVKLLRPELDAAPAKRGTSPSRGAKASPKRKSR